MSFLSYPEAINAADLQVWNNEAFDEDETEESKPGKVSWRTLRSESLFESDSFDSDSSKENRSPDLHESPVVNPVQAIGVKSNSQGKPLKLRFKQGLLGPFPNISDNEDEIASDEEAIDTEIKEIEMEISRLASKLEALRLEKTEKAFKKIESSKRRVAAEIGEQKQNLKNWTELKENGGEIYKENMTKQMVIGFRTQSQLNLENSSTQSVQALERRCYKNQEINEDKVTKRRGGRSLSPMLRVPGFNIQALPEQGFATVGSKRHVKKENGVLTSIQPKNLFSEGEKIGTTKKTGKASRVVASRYNQIPLQSSRNDRSTDQRKRSFTDNEKVEMEKCGKRRASLVAKFREVGQDQITESRVKKRWEVLDTAMASHKRCEF